jgi:hypothetical protein
MRKCDYCEKEAVVSHKWAVDEDIRHSACLEHLDTMITEVIQKAIDNEEGAEE